MKRLLAILLCVVLLSSLLVLPASALSYYVSHYEENIYAGGIVDLYAEERFIEPPSIKKQPFSLLFHQTLSVLAFFMTDFLPMAVLIFLSALLNAAGNSIFNAALMLALPEDNRSSILGSFNSASIGGQALSTLIYGFLGEIMPLYLLFAAGSLLSLVPMVRLCINKNVREFIIKSEGE